MHNGVYSYGEKALVVYPEEGQGYGLLCLFDTDHSKFCHAHFVSILTKHVCAEAILTSH